MGRVMKTFKLKPADKGLREIPTIDRSDKSTQCSGFYDPFWILERFEPNPKNAKKHSTQQLDVIYELMLKFGWAGPAIINLNTNRFVDGHGRLRMALNKKIAAKIEWGWWTEEEEESLIAVYDAVAHMSEDDPEAQMNVLETTYSFLGKNGGSADLKRLVLTLHERSKTMEKNKDKRRKLQLTRRTKLDSARNDRRAKRERLESHVESIKDDNPEETEVATVVYENVFNFPSSNPWGIPDLTPKQLFKYHSKRPYPREAWNPSQDDWEEGDFICSHATRSSIKYTESEEACGFYDFFVEDHRFENLFIKPADHVVPLKDKNFHAIFEPDFSIYDDWTLPPNLMNLYKARSVARYMQSLGIKVIPQIPRSFETTPIEPTDKARIDEVKIDDIIVTTLPTEATTFAMNGRMLGRNNRDLIVDSVINGFERAYNYNPFRCLILFGGKDIMKNVSSQLESVRPDGKKVKVIYTDAYITRRRKQSQFRNKGKKSSD